MLCIKNVVIDLFRHWRTHFLPGDEKQSVFSPMMHLSEDMIQKQEFTPAVMKQLHLIPDLK